MADNFLITIPHSGEQVPSLTPWLTLLPEQVLMCDVDRYVDILYHPSIIAGKIRSVKTQWHRYAADLNRVPEDIDCTSVLGNLNPAGMHNRGFHWVVTTYNEKLMPEPMLLETHNKLVELVYEPFHSEIRKNYSAIEQAGFKKIYHLDAHSMPSLGTKMHRDPGEQRAEIVVSDCKGLSCDPKFKDLVIKAYSLAGFKVAYNWPYFGGRLTEAYGAPANGRHAIQVEMNRSLYMDEVSKKLNKEASIQIQEKVTRAIEHIVKNLNEIS